MRALLEAHSVTWSGSWLHALSLPYTGLTLTAMEYCTAKRFQTGHDVLNSIVRCRFCASRHSGTFGFHGLSCPGQGRRISRHDALGCTNQRLSFTLQRSNAYSTTHQLTAAIRGC